MRTVFVSLGHQVKGNDMTRKQLILDAIATLSAFLIVPFALALLLPN